MIWYELTRWWAYRSIKHPKMRMYTRVLPGVLAAVLTVVFFSLPNRPTIAGPSGLLDVISDFLVLLPGFFIASLAAVSTFQRKEMDEIMPYPTPTINLRLEGRNIEYELTRRMFYATYSRIFL